MPAPSSYSEATLKQFIVDELGATGVALDLTTSAAQVVQAVYAVERVLGVSDVAVLTDMARLEAVARWQAWLAAQKAAVDQFDVKAGTNTLTRSQLWEHIVAMLADTAAVASRYPEVAAVIGSAYPVPMPFAGGLSKSAKESAGEDTDRVPPFFTRTMHEPAGVGETS